ncbi:30S ribosomal protein S8 [Mycotypha africana]|uniref:30S ribosomal protein S8 n=1 Tax=Mycotypha africana TaxID=64632 RepID=UPI002300096D|nr:30S ribosomal protein S8 [Mycotypha africana]KAI8990939.1 30S ribosomal protein S8 [Mycotypha africana]
MEKEGKIVKSNFCILRILDEMREFQLVVISNNYALSNAFRSGSRFVAVPDTKINLGLTNVLYRQGFLTSIARGSHEGPDTEYTPTTDQNRATRRLWLDLKYKNNVPAMKSFTVVSKPSRKLHFKVNELKDIAQGRRVGPVTPLQPGEIGIVNTSMGVLELNEACEKRVGGEFLCRVRT